MATSRINPEQVYVVAYEDGRFSLSGGLHETMPWHLLKGCYLYGLDEEVLAYLLIDAASRDYMILDGATSDRRGLQGFSVAIGAWGWSGAVQCRTLEAWSVIEPTPGATPTERAHAAEAILRNTVRCLNGEPTPFRPTALRFGQAVYRRLGKPMEPDAEIPPPLPPAISMMCRKAHIGGPIVHVRTTLEPFVSIDRDRAYGNVLLEDLPSGVPTEVDLSVRPLHRWTADKLSRSYGVAEATVVVYPGPLVPLMPIMRWHATFNQAKTLYPTGSLRGFWTLRELGYLIESGKGHIEDLHRVVLFEKARPFRPVIKYLRRIEPRLQGIQMKRIEHMLYGQCAKGLVMSRMASSRSDRRPIPSDLIDSRTLERMSSRVVVQSYDPLSVFRRRTGKTIELSMPLYEIRGELQAGAPHGTIDRPDRSAWITATNRIEMCKIIDQLDAALEPERSGAYIGRVYVDGIDIEATPDQIPPIPGASIRVHGPKMDIFRAGMYIAQADDGQEIVEAGHIGAELDEAPSAHDLRAILQHVPDADGGSLAGGRHWNHLEGVLDPRLVENQVSHPLHLDLKLSESLGLLMPE